MKTSVQKMNVQDDALMHLWYVSQPFEVVRVSDAPGIIEEEDLPERHRPLIAVDFGHAVWIEYSNVTVGNDEQQLQPDQDQKLELEQDQSGTEDWVGNTKLKPEVERESPKRLRFVTFPPFGEDHGAKVERPLGKTWGSTYSYEGEVRTLEIPSELDLGTVETINIDQSQGAVILSDKGGRIFILCYE